ncbi:hypothetical protein BGZ70_005965, partial [Mortierella alpina]
MARQKTLAAEFERWKVGKSQHCWIEAQRLQTAVSALARTETSLIENAAPLADNTIQKSSQRTMKERSGGCPQADQEIP